MGFMWSSEWNYRDYPGFLLGYARGAGGQLDVNENGHFSLRVLP